MRRFWSNEKGNMIIMFALALVPVMGLMGAAVDYSRASLARTKMQGALDATALYLSRLPGGITQEELDTKGTQFFYANYTETDVLSIQLAFTPAVTPGKMNLTATGTYNPVMVNIAGVTSFPVGTKTEVVWGNTRLRVALALDVTGSMSSDGKMDALKTAAKNLIDQLKNAATTTGDVYISIIPFSKDVRVATSNYTSDWVRWDLWDARNGTCNIGSYTTQSTCVALHTGSCSIPQYASQNSCQNNGGVWNTTDVNGVWTPAAHSTWNGCITDRDKDPTETANYDTKNTAPTTLTPGTLFPAEQYSSCPATMMGLSYDWTALKATIDGLAPAGNTNQGIGLVWAWQSLTQAPFTIPSYDANYVYKKIIILMSDGLNTQDRFYTSQASIDAREAIACTNAKADSVVIYAIQVNTGGDPTQAVMQNCASDSSKFFLLTSASQMVTTFQQIGTELANLHLSQ